MADSPLGVVWSLVEHVGHRAVDHGADMWDRQDGTGALMRMPTMPALPTMEEVMRNAAGAQRLPSLAELGFAEAAGGSAGAVAALAAPQIQEDRVSETLEAQGAFDPPSVSVPSSAVAERAPLTPPPAAAEAPACVNCGYSYSDEVAAGTACPNCMRKHLGAAVGASQKAAEAARRGDDEEARLYTARVAAELDVLVRYDLTPEKLAGTPPEKRQAVEAAMPCVAATRQMVGTPREVSLPWGAADESIRFARSTDPKPSDAAEIALRLQDVDTMAIAERGLLGPEHLDATLAGLPEGQRALAARARDHLRAAGHSLDRGDPTEATTLEEASGHLAVAAAALTPTPTPEEAARLEQACKVCQRTFYASMQRWMIMQKGVR